MGCDIHIEMEKFLGNHWEIVKVPFDMTLRNYDYFAILADVRNEFGTAFCETLLEKFVPISEHRGVPEDASEEYKALVKHWDCDGHSHSWVTLQDLLCYPNWNKGISKLGYVTLEHYEKWRNSGKRPERFSAGVFGQPVFILSHDDANKVLQQNILTHVECKNKCYTNADQVSKISTSLNQQIEERKKQSPKWDGTCNLYTRITWEESCLELFGKELYNNLVAFMTKQLESLPNHGPENIRLVFFFDN